MRKFVLSLSLLLLASPVLAGTFTNYSITTNTGKTYNYNPINSIKITSPQGLMMRNIMYNTPYTRINFSSNPSIRTISPRLSYLDPYVININNKNYVLIKDNKDNNWSVENILGYNDSKTDLFASLKSLEKDGDKNKISQQELKDANIRFALLKDDGTIELNERNFDYDLNKVLYIDMKNLRTALGNKNQDGTFGYFYVVVNENNKKIAVPGKVTFEEKSELNKYISK